MSTEDPKTISALIGADITGWNAGHGFHPSEELQAFFRDNPDDPLTLAFLDGAVRGAIDVAEADDEATDSEEGDWKTGQKER